MATPTCAANCDVNLPVVSFDDCNPEILFSEIRRVFIAKKNADPFTDWTDATEWETRLSQDSITGDDYIRPLTVIADKPAAAAVSKDISNGRKKIIGKDHTINVTIDDVTDENYEFMRALECGGKFRFWYETSGGKMYGGNEGFTAEFNLDDILNRGVDEIETLAGAITWRSKFSPERIDSPIFESETGGSTPPTTFDSTISFASSATPSAVAGVTGTASATDAEQAFEFNAISPRTGTPISMTIKVGGTTELVVDTTTDYSGQWFKYTDKAGTVHNGHFANGDVNF